MDKKDDKKLGRGLSALIQNSPQDGGYKEVFISNIVPNPYQPRIDAKKDIEDLAASLKEHGVLSPLIVSKMDDGRYQLIAGERRLNAAKALKWEKIPVIIKEASTQDLLVYAIVENFQRKDLNVMEEATALMNLKTTFNLKNIEIAQQIGVTDRSIRYYLKILTLPQEITDALYQETLIYAHAVALIRIDNKDIQLQIYKKILKEKLSPARTNDVVDKILSSSPKLSQNKLNILSQRTMTIQNVLKSFFGDEKVQIKRNIKGIGSVILKFKTDEELEEIYKKINKDFD